ncbi:MAG TPA: alkaline phosphatase D family protein [Pirellulaceae bacterium]|nr:alkaline phosphatase D family protein [Pirellulaceae bacterium]
MPRPFYTNAASRPIGRRSFLWACGSLAAAAIWSSRALGAVIQNPKFADYPFQLGVASGDPSPSGFVIWTRLAPQPMEGGGLAAEEIEVAWQVAEDEQMTKVVRSGKAIASPDWAHAVHVEVEGLQPDRWYWYQFRAGGEVSPKGRSRTFPAAGAQPEKLRLAFASCQHYESGYFTAYEHMAAEDIDVVAHLGDYIYEGAASKGKVREHNSREIETLDEYRNRHALYKTDPALQAAHAAFPWLLTWDDHEFDNNCAGAISEEAGILPAAFLERRARAYQAYYEHMPLRRACLPKGPDMQLFRQLDFGNLVNFFVLDTRQYRTDQPCGDGNKPQCDAALDPQATLLGDAQEKWLTAGLASSAAKWNLLAQQVMMARVDRIPGEMVAYSMDQWPGYEMNRRRLLKFFHERRISNPVVIAGDIHSNWANDLIADFDHLDSQVVASEFVGTSISSGGDGARTPKDLDRLLAENPFVRFHNAERGYVRCTVTPERWQSDYQVVEYVTKKGAPLVTRASFVVEDGQPGVKPA